jgi:protein involved in polysaccharide export with SLBB domain
VLQASDLIRVQIFQEDDLNREVRISQENTVKLPLIDTVSLKDKTVRQAEEYIRDLYGATTWLSHKLISLFSNMLRDGFLLREL